MEEKKKSDSGVSERKRKLLERVEGGGGEDIEALSLDMLSQDILETVLSWLPTSTFFRLTSVCKRWKSVSSSVSFKLAWSEISSREPWFLMVDGPSSATTSVARQDKSSVVFDSVDRNWKQLTRPEFLRREKPDSIPVASSGGLVCYRGVRDGDFTVCNPLTGSAREIPLPVLPVLPIHAIVMRSRPNPDRSFDLTLVYGEFPNLFIKSFDSRLDDWGAEAALTRNSAYSDASPDSDFPEMNEDSVYFLSKAGNVVSADMVRSPSKQYSSVLIERDGGAVVYFLSSSGTVVGCDVARRTFSEYPRLLPCCTEYSIDVIDYRGELAVAVLSEFLETASLRVWRFDEESRSWAQIAAMPPSMSHELYGKKMDINIVGSGGRLLICLNSGEVFRYIMYEIEADEWVELPECNLNGAGSEFSSAFSFEPRIEASL